MLVDKVQSTPQPSFRALKIITTPHIIEVAEKNLDKNIILAIQQAGELLGAPKAPNSTKFFDLIITQNNISHTYPYKPLLIRTNKGDYYGNFKYNNFAGSFEFSGGNTLCIEQNVHENNYLALHKNKDNTLSLADWFDFADIITLKDIFSVAQIVKMLEEVSKRAAAGKSMSDPKVVIPEPVIPEIKKPMSFENLAQTYGVDEPLYGE